MGSGSVLFEQWPGPLDRGRGEPVSRILGMQRPRNILGQRRDGGGGAEQRVEAG